MAPASAAAARAFSTSPSTWRIGADRGERAHRRGALAQLERRLNQIEATLDRLEKRIWVAVYGAASLILADIAYGLLSMTSFPEGR